MKPTSIQHPRAQLCCDQARVAMLRSVALMITLFITLELNTFAAEPADSSPPNREQIEFFERSVRPLLAANCFSCHGSKKQESGLRLDSREAVLKGGDGGIVAVPGDSGASRLIEAIRYEDDLQMPPSGKLKALEINALVKWVDAGLPWPATNISAEDAWKSHWAFQPLSKPLVPTVTNSDWARTPIDRFILAQLEANGLTPSPRAGKRTLIRRATFDLTGLPPTPEEAAAFEADASPEAYERLIDRLLASPRYGERWGRHWLDVARYADNKGYVFFEDKNYPWAYTYRDYVIRAFNEDVPYDQFVLAQLAADQLDLGEDKRSLAAMGFLTLGPHFMNNTHDIIDDRIDLVTRGLMGLTVTCARCHDHKYDPIPTADYYSLYGVFRSSYEPIVPPLFQPPPATEAYEKFAAEMTARGRKLVEFVESRYEELISGARMRVDEYLIAVYQMHGQPSTEQFMLLTDKGAINPTMIARWQLYLQQYENAYHPVWSPWHALAAIPPSEFAARADSVVRHLRDDATRPVNPLVIEALSASPLQSIDDAARRFGDLFKRIERQWQEAVSTTGQSGQPIPTALTDPAAEQLRTEIYDRGTPPDVPIEMDWGFLALFPDRPTQGEYKELLKAVEEWSTKEAAAPPRAMVLYDKEQPHEPRIFLRGNPNRLGESVPRQFPDVLNDYRQPFANGSGRLELAQAIVDPRNPLTARVIVNRVWMHHFGRGLVTTPSDFGLRSDPPSHPTLLDWLATAFIEDGWSIKRLHRLIMLSAAYQQANDNRAECKSVDQENRLLWRMNRRRLSFEALRDSLLAVSGDLDNKIGGPPIEMFGEQFVARRSVYGYIDRMDVPHLLTTFDFPEPVATSPQRDSTTVAPQALFFMNHTFTREAAERLLRRDDVHSLENDAKLQRIYSLLFSRMPREFEMQLARDYLGAEPTGEQWVQFTHALLMTNEIAFVD